MEVTTIFCKNDWWKRLIRTLFWIAAVRKNRQNRCFTDHQSSRNCKPDKNWELVKTKWIDLRKYQCFTINLSSNHLKYIKSWITMVIMVNKILISFQKYIFNLTKLLNNAYKNLENLFIYWIFLQPCEFWNVNRYSSIEEYNLKSAHRFICLLELLWTVLPGGRLWQGRWEGEGCWEGGAGGSKFTWEREGSAENAGGSPARQRQRAGATQARRGSPALQRSSCRPGE